MDSKQRAKSYLFWLLEYRGRKFLNYVGHNGFELLEKWMKLYGICIPQAGKEMPVFADFIRGNDNEELQKMSAYFTQYPDEYYFFGETFMLLSTAEEIVSLYESNKIGDKIWYILAEHGIDTGASSIEAYNAEKKELTSQSILPVKSGKLYLRDVSIDLNAHLADILTDLVAFVCTARQQAAIQELGDPTNEELKNLFDKGCPGYGPCQSSVGAKCETKDEYSFFSKTVRWAKGLGYSYTAKSDQQRTIGIWLWDYVYAQGCSVMSAIRAAEDEGILKRVGYYSAKASERGLQRAYTETSKCIAQGEVLAMSRS